MSVKADSLPATGFIRISKFLGDPKANPPIEPLIPIGRTAWWCGVREGRYPQPVKLGKRITAWRVEDIRAFIAQA